MDNNAKKNKAVLLVNIAVLLFGLVGLFAKRINLSALEMTFWRVLFSSTALGLFMLVSKKSFRIHGRRDAAIIAAAGVVLALHWWSFLGAIQISTVAIATITFSSFPLFVTFLEALVFHEKLRLRNIIIAIIILIGVAITIPELSLENNSSLGILVGMTSTFLYAVMAIMNKILSARYGSVMTAFYEQVVATLVLFPLIINGFVVPTGTDFVFLILLGVVTTAIAHTLFISSLKDIPARLAGVLSSMETVYGILMAMIFLGEMPSVREWIGAAIIIGTVVFAQLREK